MSEVTYLDVDENGVIQDAKFKTSGCGAAAATSSMMTELAIHAALWDYAERNCLKIEGLDPPGQ